jgi:hypothetical protein
MLKVFGASKSKDINRIDKIYYKIIYPGGRKTLVLIIIRSFRNCKFQ